MMDFDKIGEGMALMRVGKLMESIANTLDKLGDKCDDSDKKAAYHGASLYVLRGTLDLMNDGMSKIKEGKEA